MKREFSNERDCWNSERKQLHETLKRYQNGDARTSDRIKQLEEQLKHQKELFDKDYGSLKNQNNILKTESVAKITKIENEHNEKIEKLQAIHVRELKLIQNERDQFQIKHTDGKFFYFFLQLFLRNKSLLFQSRVKNYF